MDFPLRVQEEEFQYFHPGTGSEEPIKHIE
jgi:hypothetical protein